MRGRLPRKIKKKIPVGMYCYTYVKPLHDENGNYLGYRIKPCPFYDHIKFKDMKPQPSWIDQEYLDEYGEEKDGWCKLVKCGVEDQCKSCGEKYGF